MPFDSAKQRLKGAEFTATVVAQSPLAEKRLTPSRVTPPKTVSCRGECWMFFVQYMSQLAFFRHFSYPLIDDEKPQRMLFRSDLQATINKSFFTTFVTFPPIFPSPVLVLFVELVFQQHLQVLEMSKIDFRLIFHNSPLLACMRCCFELGKCCALSQVMVGAAHKLTHTQRWVRAWKMKLKLLSAVVGKTFHNFSSNVRIWRWFHYNPLSKLRFIRFHFHNKKRKKKCIISHVGRLLQLSSGFASLYNSQHSDLVLGEMKFYFWTVYFSYFITLARLELTSSFT